MKGFLTILIDLYARLLNLYPRSFQDTFGVEMQVVFQKMILQAAENGFWSVAQISFREMRDLPLAALREHWRGREEERTMEPQTRRNFDSPAPSWAIAAVVGFFVIPGLLDAFAFLGKIPISSQLSVVIFFGTAVLLYLLPLGIGIANHMPRWALVYLGVGIGIVGVYVIRIAVEILLRTLLIYWMELVVGPQTLPARLLWQWFNQGRFWFSIALALALFIGLLALLPRFRSLAKRFWGDYSLISFVFYGAVLIIFAIDFDEYRYDEFYQLGCMTALAAGAWGHLRIKTPGKRTLALILGVTACMAIMGVGKFILVPQQDWPIWTANHPPEAERWFESLRTIATWFWAVLAVGLPGFIQSLRKDKPKAVAYASSPAK